MLCSEAAICSPSLTTICSWTKKIYGFYGSIPAVREIQPSAYSEKWTEGSSVASILSQGRNSPRKKLDKIPLNCMRSNFWLRGFVCFFGSLFYCVLYMKASIRESSPDDGNRLFEWTEQFRWLTKNTQRTPLVFGIKCSWSADHLLQLCLSSLCPLPVQRQPNNS